MIFVIVKFKLPSWDHGPTKEKYKIERLAYHTSRYIIRSCWQLLLYFPLLPYPDPSHSHLDENHSPPNIMRSHYLTLCVSPPLTLVSFYNVEFTLNKKNLYLQSDQWLRLDLTDTLYQWLGFNLIH
jgi:hypothetical protein